MRILKRKQNKEATSSESESTSFIEQERHVTDHFRTPILTCQYSYGSYILAELKVQQAGFKRTCLKPLYCTPFP